MKPDHFTVPLFVPANRPERFVKAAQSGADAIILDLEDAVPVAEKDNAREALRADFTQLPVFLRVNALGTPWHRADIAAAGQHSFAGIIIPKAELSQEFIELVEQRDQPVMALIETVSGLVDARRIAVLTGVGRLIFGSIDFCDSLGCAHTRSALLAARAELVLASRIGGLAAPVDGVTTSIDNTALITDDAHHAAELGFGGKLAIHPKQVSPIFDGFRPAADEIAWARKVIESGEGVAAIDGAMVDEPVRARAQAILAMAGH